MRCTQDQQLKKLCKETQKWKIVCQKTAKQLKKPYIKKQGKTQSFTLYVQSK